MIKLFIPFILQLLQLLYYTFFLRIDHVNDLHEFISTVLLGLACYSVGVFVGYKLRVKIISVVDKSDTNSNKD